jgi:hypothetical protein
MEPNPYQSPSARAAAGSGQQHTRLRNAISLVFAALIGSLISLAIITGNLWYAALVLPAIVGFFVSLPKLTCPKCGRTMRSAAKMNHCYNCGASYEEEHARQDSNL